MEESNFQLGAMPFVRFLIAYLMGVGVGYHFDPNPTISLYLIIAVIVSFCLLFGVAIMSRYENFKLYGYLSISFYLFLVFLGWYLMWQGHPEIQRLHFARQKSKALIGYIADEPRVTKTSIRFPLKIVQSIRDGQEIKSSGTLLVNIRIDSSLETMLSVFEYGNELMIPAYYSLVNSPNNPNEFDYQSYLADQLIWHQIYLNSVEVLQIGSKKGNPLVSYALGFRQRMVERLDRSLQDKDALAIASALVLGYQNEISQETLDTFSITGTIHILSVSGLHVGIVFAVFSSLLFWMKGKKWKVIKAIVLVCLIWVYALITGLSPSVLRASIMISFGIVAFSFSRKGNIYNTIAASAFFLLLYNPHFISGIGFKLSYLAVLGIVVIYPKVYAFFGIKNRLLSAIWSTVAISIAAHITTFPLVLYYFHFFPVYFLPANVLVILPASFVVYLGFLVLLVPDGIIHSWLSWVLENLILAMKWVLNMFENFPYATWNGIWIEPWHYLLLYILIFGFIYFVIYRKLWAIYIVLICSIILLSDRAIEEIKNQSIEEIRIYNVYKNLGIGLFDSHNAVIYTDSLTEENQRFQYSIAPDLNASAKSSQIIYLNQGESLKKDNILIENNIIQFGNKSLLIYSKETLFNDVIYVDLLYIRNNVKVEIAELQRNIRFKKILLDASNSDWYIKEVKKASEIMNIPVYILKNNFAYVW